MHISGSCFTFSQRNVAPSVEECCIEVCHNFLKECHILLNFQRWLMRSMLLLVWVDTVLGFRNTIFLREQYAYPCKTFHISLGCRELCQEDAVLLEDKMKFSINQLLFTLAIKTCNIEANTTLSFEHGTTGQNWNFSLIFIGSIQYNISKQNWLYLGKILPN